MSHSTGPAVPVSALAQSLQLNCSDTVSPAEAAAYLGVEPATLAIWRSTKRYPLPYIKVGSRVRYRKSDLDAFLSSRTVEVSE